MKRFFLLVLLAGCASVPRTPEKLGTGYCFMWGGIERKAAKSPNKCNNRLRYMWCNREQSHKGRHHAHGVRDCYLIWK